jgi:hypothetical protein
MVVGDASFDRTDTTSFFGLATAVIHTQTKSISIERVLDMPER